MRKWLAAALLVMGAISIPISTPIASAQKPDAQGWWWQYRQPQPPVDPKVLVPDYNGAPQVPPPASVPEDGLYVAGNATGPEAISALSWVLPEGASAPTLTLVAAAPVTPTTTIRLCPTTTVWQPVQAGTWASAPQYQCDADAPVGVVPADGTTVTFTLGKLGASRLIDVALVPTEQAVFQANFNKPDDKSLTVTQTTTDTAGAGTGSSVLGTSGDPNSLNYTLTDPSYLPALSDSLQPGVDPNVGMAPTIDYSQQGGGSLSPVAAATPVKDQLQSFAMFGLLALAVLFNRFRGQETREPKSLINFGKRRDEEEVA